MYELRDCRREFSLSGAIPQVGSGIGDSEFSGVVVFYRDFVVVLSHLFLIRQTSGVPLATFSFNLEIHPIARSSVAYSLGLMFTEY